MRPISSLNGDGMATLLSKMSYIGNKYGHVSEEAMKFDKLAPSQTVKFFLLEIKNIRSTIFFHFTFADDAYYQK